MASVVEQNGESLGVSSSYLLSVEPKPTAFYHDKTLVYIYPRYAWIEPLFCEQTDITFIETEFIGARVENGYTDKNPRRTWILAQP